MQARRGVAELVGHACVSDLMEHERQDDHREHRDRAEGQRAQTRHAAADQADAEQAEEAGAAAVALVGIGAVIGPALAAGAPVAAEIIDAAVFFDRPARAVHGLARVGHALAGILLRGRERGARGLGRQITQDGGSG